MMQSLYDSRYEMSRADNSWRYTPFGKLKEITLRGRDYDFHEPDTSPQTREKMGDLISYCMALPALKRLNAVWTAIRPHTFAAGLSSRHLSNIEQLRFHTSYLHTQTLARCLSLTHNLRVFHHDYCHYDDPAINAFDEVSTLQHPPNPSDNLYLLISGTKPVDPSSR